MDEKLLEGAAKKYGAFHKGGMEIDEALIARLGRQSGMLHSAFGNMNVQAQAISRILAHGDPVICMVVLDLLENMVEDMGVRFVKLLIEDRDKEKEEKLAESLVEIAVARKAEEQRVHDSAAALLKKGLS